jgi:hypothetical protein
MIVSLAVGLQAAPALAGDQILNYEFFKSRVEPIFLKKRPEHARCYVCHSESNNAFSLEKLSGGNQFWTEEQSRRNYEVASHLVVPADPAHSQLLLQPLAPEAGGNPYHSGGRQFASKNDPDWKVLELWVRGQKAAPASGRK